MPWDQTRQTLSNQVDRTVPGGHASRQYSNGAKPTDTMPRGTGAPNPAAAPGAGQSSGPELTPSTGSAEDQLLGSGGILGGWRTSAAGVSKGWQDLLAPSPPPPNPPLTPEEQAKQNVQKVAQTVR